MIWSSTLYFWSFIKNFAYYLSYHTVSKKLSTVLIVKLWASPSVYFPIIPLYCSIFTLKLYKFPIYFSFCLELQSQLENPEKKHIMQIQRLGLEGFGSQILINVEQSSVITHEIEFNLLPLMKMICNMLLTHRVCSVYSS